MYLQETESSLKRMQQRMQEAEQRMIQDDITADDMLQIVSTDDFSKPRGKEHTQFSELKHQYLVRLSTL